jgi:hypothetical protein
MPMMKTAKASTGEPSNLTEGIHMAFLLAITDDPTPEDWPMFKNSPRMYVWHFAVYQTPNSVGREIPEYLTGLSSQTFSYGGKRSSKAYDWTVKLLGRSLALGESVDLDPMMPLPCQVAISKKNASGETIDFAKITELYAWPDGASWLQNAAFVEGLSRFWDSKKPDDAPPFPRSSAQVVAGATGLAPGGTAPPATAPAPVAASAGRLPF